jgi:hypothetical protein
MALGLLLVACEREWPVDGSLVSVKINLMGVAESESDEVLRAAGHAPQKFYQLMDNGMELEVVVTPDTALSPAATRAAMGNNIKYRVLAVKNGAGNGYADGELIALADCSVGAANNPEFFVPRGVSCHFYCISYNETTAMATTGYTIGNVAPNLPVNSTKDFLLWHDIQSITADNQLLNIHLYQQLAKVRLQIDSSPANQNITAIGNGITLSPLAVSGNFDYKSNTLTGESAGARAFSSTWATYSATNRVHPYLTVFPVASENLTLTIPANTITLGTTVPAVTATVLFSGATLAGGKSYTARVKILKGREGFTSITMSRKFAGSNIYWDGTKLTFMPYDYVGVENKYQGVYFRFGSLVGFAADGYLDVPLYIPVYDASNKTSTWRTSILEDEGGYSFQPYTDDGTENGRNSFWATHIDRNTNAKWNELKGDICQYIATTQGLGNYRLPISNEFGSGSDWGTWQTGTNTSSQHGRSTVNTGRFFLENGSKSIFFPAAGFRQWGKATFGRCLYWGSSIAGVDKAIELDMMSGDPSFDSASRPDQQSIRCILQEQ